MKLKIDREKERLELASSKTNLRFIPTPFWKLFGNPKRTMIGFKPPTEEESKKEMSDMKLSSDEDFEKKLVGDFARIGYTLISSKCL